MREYKMLFILHAPDADAAVAKLQQANLPGTLDITQKEPVLCGTISVQIPTKDLKTGADTIMSEIMFEISADDAAKEALSSLPYPFVLTDDSDVFESATASEICETYGRRQLWADISLVNAGLNWGKEDFAIRRTLHIARLALDGGFEECCDTLRLLDDIFVAEAVADRFSENRKTAELASAIRRMLIFAKRALFLSKEVVA